MRALKLIFAALLLLSALPAASVVSAQKSVVFGGSAQFLPAPVGVYLAINLAPDAAQMRNIQKLADYYMQDPQVASALASFMTDAPSGMSPDELRDGFTSWAGGEAFFAVPRPEDLQALVGQGPSTMSSRRRMMQAATDAPILVGVAVRDRIALVRFLAQLRDVATQSGGDSSVSVTLHNGAEVLGFSGSDGTAWVAMARGYLLLSPSQDRLYEAIDRDPADSLLGSASFQEAARSSAQSPLALLYLDSPSQIYAIPNPTTSLGANATTWIAATLRFGDEGLRLDTTSAMDPSQLTPTLRALASQPPNPLQAARLAPRDTAALLGVQNLALEWAAVREALQGSPDAASALQNQLVSIETITALNVDDDVFGWMTGETALFFSPGSEAPVGIGTGLLIQARDPALAQAKVDKIVDALDLLGGPDIILDTQDIGGVPFNRMRSESDGLSVYLGLVNGWVIVADDADVVAGIVGRTQGGDSGLAGDPGFTSTRAAMPAGLQSLMFVDVSRLTDMIVSAAEISDADIEDTRFFLAPIKRLGAGSASTPDRSRSTFLVQIQVP
jgi:hypothetical protein